MDKISIIVPVYNTALQTAKCLDSLVNQTYKNIEIIVINDGSTDNSKEVINEYAKKYSNIIAINQKNLGVSAARNAGLKKATGKYLTFVDGDDYVLENMYELLYNKIKKDNLDVVVCNYLEVYADNTSRKAKVNCQGSSIIDNPKMIHQMDFGPCNKLYKRKLWNNVVFPLNTKYEDLEAVLKVFLKAKKIGYLDEYLYCYYQNVMGQTFVIDDRVYDIFKILKHIFDVLPNNEDLYYNFEILCVRKVFEYVYRLIELKDKEKARSFYITGYKFLDDYCKDWKEIVKKSSNIFKEKIMNYYKIHPLLFKIYIKLR